LYRKADGHARTAERLAREALAGRGGPGAERRVLLEAARRFHCRAAAEAFGRLDGAMARASARQRDHVANRAGKAWVLAGSPARALPFFQAVCRRSADPRARAEALAGAAGCHLAAGEAAEARRCLAKLREGLRGLGRKERAEWEAWLIRAEGIDLNVR
jgi:hypothetical protein